MFDIDQAQAQEDISDNSNNIQKKDPLKELLNENGQYSQSLIDSNEQSYSQNTKFKSKNQNAFSTIDSSFQMDRRTQNQSNSPGRLFKKNLTGIEFYQKDIEFNEVQQILA